VGASTGATVEVHVCNLAPVSRGKGANLRGAVLDNLQPGFVEGVARGLVSYQVAVEISGPPRDRKLRVYTAMASRKDTVPL